MIKIETDGQNLRIFWDNPQERKEVEKLKNRIPRYSLDLEGDYTVDSYEFSKDNLLPIIGLIKSNETEINEKAKGWLEIVTLDSTPWEELSKIDLKDVNFPKPPKDFQRKFLEINAAKDNMLLLMSVGSGKTLVSLYRYQLLKGKKLLIIAPKKNVKYNQWKNEIKECLGEDCLIFWGTPKTRPELLKKVKDFNIIASTYEQVGYLEGFKADFIIIDEAHLIRNEKSKRHKNVKKHLKPKQKKIVMTGTPKPSRLEGFWTLLKIVSPTLAGSKKNFLNKFQKPTRFMEVRKTLPSGVETTFRIPIEFQEIKQDELFQLISPVTYSVSQEDVVDFENCIEPLNLDMNPKQTKAYKDLANELFLRKKQGQLNDGEQLTYILRLRQISEGLFNLPDYNSLDSNKWDYITDTIDELEEDEKLIIWSCFKPITELLYAKYKDRAVLFNGSVTDAQMRLGLWAFNGVDNEEDAALYEKSRFRVKGWQHDRPGKANLLFGVINEVSSIGVNLQRYCQKQIVSAQSDLYATDLQALARIVRIGQKADYTLSEYLFSNGSAEKMRFQSKLMNYQSGVEITQGKTSSTYDMILEIQRSLS